MPLRSRLTSLWRNLLRRDQIEQELTQEVRAYLDMLIEAKLRDGLNPADARRAALIEMGGVEQVKERVREVRMGYYLETIWQDLRLGARMLLKHPGFTFIAVLTLTLGIGANTAIFSVLNSVLLRPLPYRAADRLVWIWDSNASAGYPRFGSAGPNFKDWQQQSVSFEYMAAFAGWSFNLTNEGEPERIQGALASPDLFPMLGIKPVIGRVFLPAEEQAGNHRVALLSYGLWQRRFAADPGILNRSLTLNGENYTVIGIVPADFRSLYQADIWTPLALDVLKSGRGSHFLNVIAQLKPDVSIQQAQTEMNGITTRLQQQYSGSNTGWSTELQPLHERIVGNIKPVLWILSGVVGLVLLIACANVANLLMARAASRQKEVAIRAALGADRLRLVRQFLTESLLLSLIGGGLGLLLGIWGMNLLVALSRPGDIPRAEEISIDGRVLAFTLLVSLVTGIIFGIVPALQSSKINLNESLKAGSRAVSSSLSGNRTRRLMVISEIALAMVLLVGAGLMIKSLLRLTQVRLGFEPENLLTMHISLPQSKYTDGNRQATFENELLDRIGNLPGVQSVATISPLPLAGGDSVNEFFIEGRESPSANQGFNANLHRCSSDYFLTMKIPLLKGRFFDERDVTRSEQVVIINDTLARRFWNDENPVGKRISLSGLEGPWHTIAGVVGDVRHGKLENEAGFEIYRSYTQSPIPYMALVVRSDTTSSGVISSIRNELSALDSTLPVYSIRPMEQLIARSLAPRRFQMILLSSFAGLALILAIVGIYGVISYSVTERRHELGIRLALGAQSRDLLVLVMSQGMKLALVGTGLGLVAAFALTRLMQTLLYSVSPTDPLTFAMITILLTLVALLACWIPARRAARVDPLVALRHE
jgi:predicted permease